MDELNREETGIETLDLSRRGLKKIEKASAETTTTVVNLVLDQNELQRLDNIETYSRVENVSICNNFLVRMHGVSRLTNLRELALNANGILQIEGLKDLIHLRVLRLAGNNIKSIEHLNHNIHLELLDLSNNQIAFIADISYLRCLKHLNLERNRVIDLRQCDRYLPPNLEHLNLGHNNIQDLNEISHLVHLVKLDSFHIQGNPCVGLAGKDKLSFEYRPFVLNWILSVKSIDGIAVSAIESLKAEWLYSQGKGRHFHSGQHRELCDYLASTCPLVLDATETEDQRKLRLILSKAQQHQQQLKESPVKARVQSPRMQTRIASRYLGRSPDRLTSSYHSATSKTSSAGHSLMSDSCSGELPNIMSQSFDSPGLFQDQHCASVPKTMQCSETTKNTGQTTSVQKTIHQPSELPKSTTVHKTTTFQSIETTKTPPSQHKIIRQPVEISKTTSVQETTHQPKEASKMTPVQTLFVQESTQQPKESSKVTVQTVQKPFHQSLEAASKMVPVPESLMSPDYQDYDQLMQRSMAKPSSLSSSSNSSLQDDKRPRRVGSPKLIKSATSSPKLKPKMEQRKNSLTPTKIQDGVKNLNGVNKKDFGEKLEIMKLASNATNQRRTKGINVETLAAVTIQKMWRGYRSRNLNKETLRILHAIQAARARQHIQRLTCDMEATKAALDSERKIQQLQMQAINALWKKVSTLQESKKECLDDDVLRRLSETCLSLQAQVESLQGSMQEVLRAVSNKSQAEPVATQTDIVAVMTPQEDRISWLKRPQSLPLEVLPAPVAPESDAVLSPKPPLHNEESKHIQPGVVLDTTVTDKMSQSSPCGFSKISHHEVLTPGLESVAFGSHRLANVKLDALDTESTKETQNATDKGDKDIDTQHNIERRERETS